MTTTTSSADRPRERRGSRLAALLLALALLLGLSACGQSDPVCGRWFCVSAETEGLEVPAALFGAEDVSLFLSSDGRGTLSRNGQEGGLRWERREDALLLDLGEQSLRALEQDGDLLLSIEPGLTLRFAREDRAAEPAAETAETLCWYGWWEVSNSQGRMPDSWRDCCAILETGPYGPELLLWDEDSSRDEPLAAVQLRREGNTLVSASGFFLRQELQDGDWRLNPGTEPLELSGAYAGEGEAFDFRILLRPWGALWPEDARRPFHYTDWYLPRIDTGEPMPHRIG